MVSRRLISRRSTSFREIVACLFEILEETFKPVELFCSFSSEWDSFVDFLRRLFLHSAAPALMEVNKFSCLRCGVSASGYGDIKWDNPAEMRFCMDWFVLGLLIPPLWWLEYAFHTSWLVSLRLLLNPFSDGMEAWFWSKCSSLEEKVFVFFFL